jgi:hypothetical protein
MKARHWCWQGGYIFLAVAGLFRSGTPQPEGYAFHPKYSNWNHGIHGIHGFCMSYEIQALHPMGEEFHFRRTLIAMHTIRENPVRQAKTGFSINLKCDQHVK